MSITINTTTSMPNSITATTATTTSIPASSLDSTTGGLTTDKSIIYDDPYAPYTPKYTWVTPKEILTWDEWIKLLDWLFPVNEKIEDPIEKVIFNYPATIVFWKDGTKTVVKCQYGETFDEEKGIALCFMKKYFDNKGYFNDIFKKYI